MARKRTAAVAASIATVAILGLGWLAWSRSDIGRASSTLEALRVAARREGVPVDYDQLRAMNSPVKPEENGSVPLERGFAGLEAAHVRASDKLLGDLLLGAADPKDVAKAEEDLAKVAASLTEIARGAARPNLVFERDWEKGAALTFPEYTNVRTASKLLCIRALLATDPKDAIADLRTAARLRAKFTNEPVLIGGLTAQAIEADVHRTVRELARRSPANAGALLPILDDLGPLPDLHRVLAGESAMEANLTKEIGRYGIKAFVSMDGQGVPPSFRLLGFGPARDAFQARIIEYWRNVYAKLPKDPIDYVGNAKALDMSVAEHGGPSYDLLRFVSPVFSGVTKLAAEDEANRRITRTAIELWEGKNPRLPADPFSRSSLKLKRSGSDWTLYSVGPDGIDDGGKPRGRTMTGGYDLVVPSKLPALPPKKR